jgi:phosphoribosyl 1,2-cyclic phosphodiesterase
MRVTILASGSRGNATLVEAGGTRVLVDAGIGPRCVEERMRAVFGRVVDLDGILVTHPHGDHVGEVERCARHFDVPVYLTEGTRRRVPLAGLRTRVFGHRTPFRLGALDVRPLPIPHDAPQIAVVFAHDVRQAGIVTDLGHVPPGLAAHLADCQLLLMESNHDPTLVRRGPYPDFLKKRILSPVGHLSNAQCGQLLSALGPALEELVLVHLSETCNKPLLALTEARAALARRRTGRAVRVRCAEQDVPLDVAVPLPPRGLRPRARPSRMAVSPGTQLALDL